MVRQSEILPGRVNWNYEIALTVTGLIFTLMASVFLMQDLGSLLREKVIAGYKIGIAEQVAFIVIVAGLIYGNIIYQLSRLGFLVRDKNHGKSKAEHTLYLFEEGVPSLTILVPSYKEEIKVIYQTLMSAALQEYPDKRITLLVDDPPFPGNEQDKAALRAAQALPAEISAFLEGPRSRYLTERAAFLSRVGTGSFDRSQEKDFLADAYADAARILGQMAQDYQVQNHTDRLFVDKILKRSADDLGSFADELRNGPVPEDLGQQEIWRHYNRLIARFSAQLSSFGRKRYENLSHEKNKAMNLNTYIGLMGKNYQEVHRDGRFFLEECEGNETLSVPDSQFIITLDADSLILPDYARRLVHVMMQPGNERLAVVQTPYSAIPGASNELERVAGATTDIQLLVHQGFSWLNATFWVGANALLRKTALEDIKIIEEERGYSVTRYIQDRTVIEDTESSIDLVDRGWSLSNYPARLAYSATPPDYGSLLIQRRRWANGGLIIMPKLIRHTARKFGLRKMTEAFVRFHYLASIALTSFGVLALILYPFENVMRTWWLPLSAIPYFYLYARDLKLSGYGWLDMPRVYALNLLLLPVNLGGVLKSIQQGITGEKIPFVRTPKIENRIAAPALYVMCEFLIFAYMMFAFAVDSWEQRWMHAGFSLLNAAFFGYALTYFLGWKEGCQDVAQGWRSRLMKRAEVKELAHGIVSSSREPKLIKAGGIHYLNRENRIMRFPQRIFSVSRNQHRDAA